ncbi:MAG TPA: cupin domain-containing protein [Candidatus Nitrosopelagicus sp.]|nr:cupin domain-containing protein [Candidatus Nitrosopelagicus sp.]
MKFEYNIDDYIRKINSGTSYFNTFLDKDTLAAGVLVLKPGEEDTQLPHESDEMYYILEGDGFLKIKNKNYKLKKGKAFFVPKDTEHYFFGNKTKLKVLYFFGGPDS